MNGPYGLDFGAVMTMAAARGAASALLAEVLPDVELILVGLMRGAGDVDGGEEG